MSRREICLVFARYLSLVLIALPNLFLFYFIFTPLTIYPVYLITKIFYPSIILSGNFLVLGEEQAISLIPACIAGSAFYLLAILNLSTPMKIKTRIKSLIFLFASFLILNIMRVSIFSSMFLEKFQYFDLSHKITWYAFSILIAVLLWFANVYLFKIKSIPFFTDARLFYLQMNIKKTMCHHPLKGVV